MMSDLNPTKIMTSSACGSRRLAVVGMCPWACADNSENLALLFVDFGSEEYLISFFYMKLLAIIKKIT
jgi:hypothetical protein